MTTNKPDLTIYSEVNHKIIKSKLVEYGLIDCLSGQFCKFGQKGQHYEFTGTARQINQIITLLIFTK